MGHAKLQIIYLILLSHLIFCQISIAHTAETESTNVKLSKTNSAKYPYHLKTTLFGKPHHMKLQRLSKLKSEVFSPHFKLQTQIFNPKANQVSVKSNPVSEKFKKLHSQNIFTDPKIPGSHILITRDPKSGHFNLQGFLTYDRIIKPGLFGNHTVVKHNSLQNHRFKRDIVNRTLTDGRNNLSPNYKDYIETNITLHHSATGRARVAAGPIIVEVLVIADFEFSKRFSHNRSRLMHYIAIFFRTVNLRFAQIDMPRIVFRVSEQSQ